MHRCSSNRIGSNLIRNRQTLCMPFKFRSSKASSLRKHSSVKYFGCKTSKTDMHDSATDFARSEVAGQAQQLCALGTSRRFLETPDIFVGVKNPEAEAKNSSGQTACARQTSAPPCQDMGTDHAAERPGHLILQTGLFLTPSDTIDARVKGECKAFCPNPEPLRPVHVAHACMHGRILICILCCFSSQIGGL